MQIEITILLIYKILLNYISLGKKCKLQPSYRLKSYYVPFANIEIKSERKTYLYLNNIST